MNLGDQSSNNTSQKQHNFDDGRGDAASTGVNGNNDNDAATATTLDINNVHILISNLSSNQKDQILLLLCQNGNILPQVQQAIQQVVVFQHPDNIPNHQQVLRGARQQFGGGDSPGMMGADSLLVAASLNQQQQQQQLSPSAEGGAAGRTPRKRSLPVTTNNNDDDDKTKTMPPTTTATPGVTNKRQRRKRNATTNSVSKSELWDTKFEALKDYKEEFGTTTVPIKYPPNPQLGRWCDNQRQAYRKYQNGDYRASWLNEERIAKLDAIGFTWRANPNKTAGNIPLEQRLTQMKEWKSIHGHLKVPLKEKSGLGKWIFDNRRNYQLKKMSEQHYKALDDVGFPWVSPFPKHSQWENRMSRLTEFQQKYGHCNLPEDYATEDSDLYHWVRQIRQVYHRKIVMKNQEQSKDDDGNNDDDNNKKNGIVAEIDENDKGEDRPLSSGTSVGWKLSDERIAALVRLGFDFKGYKPKTKPWEERFKELQAFKKQHGHCFPGKLLSSYEYYSNNNNSRGKKGRKNKMKKLSKEDKEYYTDLNAWLTRARSDCKRNVLSKDRSDKLRSIGAMEKTRLVNGEVVVIDNDNDDNHSDDGGDDDDDTHKKDVNINEENGKKRKSTGGNKKEEEDRTDKDDSSSRLGKCGNDTEQKGIKIFDISKKGKDHDNNEEETNSKEKDDDKDDDDDHSKGAEILMNTKNAMV